ncbi:unnamed protein product, partial [Didymodactylos carnosus]
MSRGKTVNPRVAPPRNLQVTGDCTSKSVTFVWTPVPTATGYKIEELTCLGRYQQIAVVNNGATNQYVHQSKCTQCFGHRYAMAAIDCEGVGNYSKAIPLSYAAHSTSIASTSSVLDKVTKVFSKSTTPNQPTTTTCCYAGANTKITLASPNRYAMFVDQISANKLNLISVRKGDLTAEKINSISGLNDPPLPIFPLKVDVIVVCSSSRYLKEAILKAAGDTVTDEYKKLLDATQNNAATKLISTSPGQLPCKRIYFLPWKLESDITILRQSIIEFVSTAIQKALRDKYQSIAFPAIGCGKYKCATDVVAETMVQEAHKSNQISVHFIIQVQQDYIYNEFHKQLQQLNISNKDEQQLINENKIVTNIAKGTIEVNKGDLTKQEV